MCKKLIWLSAFVLVLGLTGNAFAVTTWTGTESSDWFDPCNWSDPNKEYNVPTSADWADITGTPIVSTLDAFEGYTQTGTVPYQPNDLRYTWHHGEEDFSSGSVISFLEA